MNKVYRRIILLTDISAVVELVREIAGKSIDIKLVRTKHELTALADDCTRRDLILSYSIGLIVPQRMLRTVGGAYNIHGASPEYPGRDPHHFACYDGVTKYGATAHIMTERVDAGPIVDVEMFEVVGPATAFDLLKNANAAAIRLLKRLVPILLAAKEPLPEIGLKWGPRKTTREDFERLCTIAPGISKPEFERRMQATAMPNYDNLRICLHGVWFRLRQEAAEN